MHAGACKWLWPWGIVESGDELAPGRGLGTAGVEMCVPDGVIAAGTSVRSPASLQLRACDPELLQPWPLVCSGDVNAYFQDSWYRILQWLTLTSLDRARARARASRATAASPVKTPPSDQCSPPRASPSPMHKHSFQEPGL